MSRRRRRFHHWGMYFPDTSGLRGALIDAGQLTLCLEALLGKRGVLDAELVPARGVGSRRPEPAVSVRDALGALRSAFEVFSECAAVVERAWQAMEQCGVMLDAAEATGDEQAASRWLLAYDVCARLAGDESPVRRDVLTAARAVLRAHKRSSAKVMKAGASHGESEGEVS